MPDFKQTTAQRWRVLLWSILLCTAALVTFSPAGISFAGNAGPNGSHGNCCTSTTGYVSTAYTQEDGVRNYDFLTQSVTGSNVDQPMDIIWLGNATVNQTKTNLQACCLFDGAGSSKNGRISDAYPYAGSSCTAWCWDTDSGRKTVSCSDYHTRIYAPAGADRLWNAEFQYYVVGSSHMDINDYYNCGGGASYGYSETAEYNIWAGWANTWGNGFAWYDSGQNTSGNNYEPFWQEGNNFWNNDGWMTWLRDG
jgi:hypothetical protein